MPLFDFDGIQRLKVSDVQMNKSIFKKLRIKINLALDLKELKSD